MLRLTSIATELPGAELLRDAPRLRLTYQERVRSRLAAVLPNGQAVAILLPRGSVLRNGAVLSGDGACVVVEAAAEPLARITAPSPHALMRAVYHLANRHVPTQLAAECALIERDAVLERMLNGLGASVEHVEAVFEPEPGAYDGHAHAHGASPRDAPDDFSATVGEQLSIAAHRARNGA